MTPESIFLFALCALVAAKATTEILLLALARRRALALKAGPIPAEARAAFASREEFDKAMAYSAAKSTDAIVFELGSVALTFGLIFGGVAFLNTWVEMNTGGVGIIHSIAAAILFMLVMTVFETPFELHSTFGTESRFGFNRMTPGLWITDKLKGLFFSAILVAALIAPCYFFYEAFPRYWWLLAWGLFAIFQMLAAGLLTVVLLPIFNKLTPLEDGALKDRLLGLASRAGFKAASVQVMDGSKRSAHANAFFAGFGRMRRIVLFDTLINQLTPEELEAVLAHEIGHWKRGHIRTRLINGVIGSLPVFALAGWISHSPELFTAFRLNLIDIIVPFPVLIWTFPIIISPVLFWLNPLTNGRSRRHEYEADAYAADLVNGSAPLVGALRKLYAANSGNPLPHPAYARFHHSHPTLPERELALARHADRSA